MSASNNVASVNRPGNPATNRLRHAGQRFYALHWLRLVLPAIGLVILAQGSVDGDGKSPNAGITPANRYKLCLTFLLCTTTLVHILDLLPPSSPTTPVPAVTTYTPSAASKASCDPRLQHVRECAAKHRIVAMKVAETDPRISPRGRK